MNKAVVIGYGKLGSHLYHAIKKTGKFKQELIKNSKSSLNHYVINDSDIVFICVQDSKIAGVVKKLSGNSFELKGKYIFHTSGSLTSGKLLALSKKGANTGSFHPVQTFEKITNRDAGRFKDIYAAIEGNAKTVKKGFQISKSIGAKPFVILKKNKIYHHICCVFASNFLAVLIRQVEKIGTKKIRINGFKKLSFFNIYKPLASRTLSNIAEKGAVKSLTGPIERNDLNTIIQHLKAINNKPDDLLPFYLLMGIETVKLALEKKSIKLTEAKKILKTFDKFRKINKVH